MPSSFPLMVVRDLLWLVLTGGSPDYLAPIQTEVHLIKQLSGSLSPKSERLGWQLKGRGALLAVLPARLSREELRRVLPTLAHDHFACKLHARARARALNALVYPRKRLGALRKVPTEEQITTMLVAARRRRDESCGYGRLGTHATAAQHTTLHSACGAARQSPVRLARSVSRARFSRLLHSTQGTGVYWRGCSCGCGPFTCYISDFDVCADVSPIIIRS